MEVFLWRAYRETYRQYEHAAAQLARTYDAAELESALLSLEQARLAYNDARDNLAAFLMPTGVRQTFWAIPSQESRRVKGLAELFWEFAGRPQGTADADWYRAERVVRHATAEMYAGR